MRRTAKIALPVLLASLICILLAAPAVQAAEIRGTVTDDETGTPLPATTIQVVGADGQSLATTTTDKNGHFRLTDLPEGIFTLVVSRLSYASQSMADVRASPFAETVLDVKLVPSPLGDDTIVVTASRRQETGLGAPAATSVIDRVKLTEQPQLTPLDLTREVTGVDFASKGMFNHNLSIRGQRWAMSIMPLLLTDYRFAHVPMMNFTLAYMLPMSSDDIERIEVVRGPSTVLYGPNSHQGVIHVITRSPLAAPGTMISVLGGTRDMFQGTFRHAVNIADRIGLKISGRWFQAHDWEYVDPIEQRNRQAAIAAGADPATLKIGARDPNIENVAGEARLDWRLGDSSTLVLTGGLAQAINHIDINHAFAGMQFRDWRMSFGQARLMSGRFLANLYYNYSHTGETFMLRAGLPVKDNSRLGAAQLQHGTEIAGSMRLVYGLDGRFTDSRTYGTIHGRNEDNDTVSELGAYLNSTTTISTKWDIVAAARVDYHDRINSTAISPRAGFIFRPAPAQAFRMTWNRAFNSPSSPEIFIDMYLGSAAPGIARHLVGFPKDGYTFNERCEGGLCMRSPYYDAGVGTILPTDATLMWSHLAEQIPELAGVPAPDAAQVGSDLRRFSPQTASYSETMEASELQNAPKVSRIISNTWELGYKGRLAGRAFLAIDVHRTLMQNYPAEGFYLNPNVFLNEADLCDYLETVGGIPADEAAALAAEAAGMPLGTVVPDGQEGAEILYVNQLGGSFTNWGVDVTAELSLSRHLLLSGNYSWLEKNVAVMPGVGENIMSVPRNKAALGLAYRDEPSGLDGRLQSRWVQSYLVGSGPYLGQLPTYIVLDVGVGWRLSWSPYLRWSCDILNVLDNRHQEWIGAPELGRLVTTRLQVNF